MRTKPSKTPHLDELKASELADRAEVLVMEQVRHLAALLGDRCQVILMPALQPALAHSPLRQAVLDSYNLARRDEEPLDDDVPTVARAFHDALYGRALDRGNPDDRIRFDLVARALGARQRLARGEPLSTAQLAALACLSPRSIQLAVEKKELAREAPDTFAAAECQRWLDGF